MMKDLRWVRMWVTWGIAGMTVAPHAGWADGALISRFGTYVAEQEQRAFIEVTDGQERMFLATRMAEQEGPALWMVPFPADPAQVRAEPSETFPRVTEERPRVQPSMEDIPLAISLVVLSDLGLSHFPLGALFLLAQGKGFRGIGGALEDGVTVHSHVEKLGMVVEVLSTESPSALDAYLLRQGIQAQAGNLEAVAPYLGKGYALVCAWLSRMPSPDKAAAIRVEFPSPDVYYPLRPTSVYTHPIDTTIYVRGNFRPRPGLGLPGLQCHYVDARLTEGKERFDFSYDALTKVTLTSLPSSWHSDLRMEPGVPAPVRAAKHIRFKGLWVVSGLVALLLAQALPQRVFPASGHRAMDRLWAVAVGVGLWLSAVLGALVFYRWCRARHPNPPPRSRGLRKWDLALQVSTLLFVLGYGMAGKQVFGYGVWFEDLVDSPFVLFLIAAWLAAFVCLEVGVVKRFITVVGGRWRWFAALAVGHMAICVVALWGLFRWIAPYNL